jgi:hypothetical protein
VLGWRQPHAQPNQTHIAQAAPPTAALTFSTSCASSSRARSSSLRIVKSWLRSSLLSDLYSASSCMGGRARQARAGQAERGARGVGSSGGVPGTRPAMPTPAAHPGHGHSWRPSTHAPTHPPTCAILVACASSWAAREVSSSPAASAGAGSGASYSRWYTSRKAPSAALDLQAGKGRGERPGSTQPLPHRQGRHRPASQRQRQHTSNTPCPAREQQVASPPARQPVHLLLVCLKQGGHFLGHLRGMPPELCGQGGERQTLAPA